MSYELIGILLLGLGQFVQIYIALRLDHWRDAYDAALLRRVETIARRLAEEAR